MCMSMDVLVYIFYKKLQFTCHITCRLRFLGQINESSLAQMYWSHLWCVLQTQSHMDQRRLGHHLQIIRAFSCSQLQMCPQLLTFIRATIDEGIVDSNPKKEIGHIL
jgi:hypothetical protein